VEAFLSPATLALQTVSSIVQQVSLYASSIVSVGCNSIDCGVYDMLMGALKVALDVAKGVGGLNDATIQQISSSLSLVVTNSTISSCPTAFLLSSVIIDEVIAAAAAAIGTSDASAADLGLADAASTSAATTALTSLGDSLSSLVVGVDSGADFIAESCKRLAQLNALVTQTLTAQRRDTITGKSIHLFGSLFVFTFVSLFLFTCLLLVTQTLTAQRRDAIIVFFSVFTCLLLERTLRDECSHILAQTYFTSHVRSLFSCRAVTGETTPGLPTASVRTSSAYKHIHAHTCSYVILVILQ
jgi:hypothetical protein